MQLDSGEGAVKIIVGRPVIAEGLSLGIQDFREVSGLLLLTGRESSAPKYSLTSRSVGFFCPNELFSAIDSLHHWWAALPYQSN
jgi:hypothetical protein